jgi:hypothetical protein
MFRKYVLPVLLLTLFVLVSCGSQPTTAEVAPTSEPIEDFGEPESTPTPVPDKRFQVGEVVTITLDGKPTWEITIHDVRTQDQDGDYLKPKDGSVYVVLNVTTKNVSSGEETTSYFNFSLKTPDGIKYNPRALIYGESAPTGPVEAGGQLKGDIAFEVPIGQDTFILNYQHFASRGLIQWDIKL